MIVRTLGKVFRTLDQIRLILPHGKQESQTRGQVRAASTAHSRPVEAFEDAISASNQFEDTRRMTMPLIQVKLIENVFTPAQKSQMITKLTDAMVSIEGENMRQVTWVVIEEARSGDWGIGGQALTTSAVQALAAGHK
jgi:4-oxalocrotonate tautomerase